MKFKKRYAYNVIVVAVLLAVLILYFKPFNLFQKKTEKSQQTQEKSIDKENVLWRVDKNGYLYYPLDRGEIRFRRDNLTETKDLTVSKIIYESRNGNIYGLFVLPKKTSDLLPGVVLIPGAGVSKESELKLAEEISELGIAVLTIDQRGIGETDGKLLNLDEDYANFLTGKEPYQHLMIYDALRGFDLLRSAPFIDHEKIVMMGESLGGRVAIIAAALDRNVKGVLVVSTAGFDFAGGPDANKNVFVKSIDPDHYINLITPRKLVMMHNLNDKNIPINFAVRTFKKAQEPKRFIYVNDTSCNHGYCDSMYGSLLDGLNYLAGIERNLNISVVK